MKYPFTIIHGSGDESASDETLEALRMRPAASATFEELDETACYQPDEALENAINAAIAIGSPLLITGEPGTGKTQSAYFVARKLGVKLFRFQAKSFSQGQDLLYSFDAVSHFRDSQLYAITQPTAGVKGDPPATADYVHPGYLWQAIDEAAERDLPAVLLIDEIDKAPRDFPNDLLREIDRMEFEVPEIREDDNAKQIKLAKPGHRPLTFITSNSERPLPEPFLRRCICHHIDFTKELAWKAVNSHQQSEYPDLSPAFVERAMECFFKIRRKNLRKRPATGELLAWLQVLAAKFEVSDPEVLNVDLKDLPHLHSLVKVPEDQADMRK